MSSTLEATQTPARIRRPSLRVIAIAALVANALLWAFTTIPSVPPQIYMPKIIGSLVIAGIVALRYRWTPVLGALWCAVQLAEGFIFLRAMLAAVDSAATFTVAGIFFAITVVGLVASIGASDWNVRFLVRRCGTFSFSLPCATIGSTTARRHAPAPAPATSPGAPPAAGPSERSAPWVRSTRLAPGCAGGARPWI